MRLRGGRAHRRRGSSWLFQFTSPISACRDGFFIRSALLLLVIRSPTFPVCRACIRRCSLRLRPGSAFFFTAIARAGPVRRRRQAP